MKTSNRENSQDHEKNPPYSNLVRMVRDGSNWNETVFHFPDGNNQAIKGFTDAAPISVVGSKAFYRSKNNALMQLDLISGAVSQRDNECYSAPRACPDDTYLFYKGATKGSPARPTIRRITIASGEGSDFDPKYQNGPAFYKDGNDSYVVWAVDDRPGELWIRKTDGSNDSVRVGVNTSDSFSISGTKLVYRDQSNSRNLYVRDLSTNNTKQIGSDCDGPPVTDGSLVFYACHSGGKTMLKKRNIDGTNAKFDPNAKFVMSHLSLKGGWISFFAKDGNIFQIKSDFKATRTIVNPVGLKYKSAPVATDQSSDAIWIVGASDIGNPSEE